MQRRNILAMLAGLAIAAPMVGAQQQAAKTAAPIQKAAPVQKAAKAKVKEVPAPAAAPAAATAVKPVKPDSAKPKVMRKKGKKPKKAS
jgi:hypothetical protein